MKFLWFALILIGVYMIASSLTVEGLLPSGHGTGPLSEALVGIASIAYGAYRLLKK